MVIGAEARLQYLSNSGFLLTTEEGRRVVIDPYLTDNAAAPFGPERIPPLDLIIVTHAAFDHLGDAFYLAKRDGASLVCDYLVRQLAYAEGLSKEQVKSCSYGGTVNRGGVTLRVLQATHTSYIVDDVGRPSTGIPLAFLITTAKGLRIYHAGDTCLLAAHRPDSRRCSFSRIREGFTAGRGGTGCSMDRVRACSTHALLRF